jgi:hypothetical protein
MRLFGRTITSPVTLLPLDAFQRHLLSGLSGLLIWFIASVKPAGTALSGEDFVWSWRGIPPFPSLLEGLGGHLESSATNLIFTLYDSNQPRSGAWIKVAANYLPDVFELLAVIIGFALLAASVVMLLGAFKIMTYPSRLQRFAPSVLSILIVTIVAIQVIVLPFTAITDAVFARYPLGFDVEYWVSGIVAITIELILPIAVLLISLVPIFAPVKKNSKAKQKS